MIKETMTIHKALSELKVLNSRITDEIMNTRYVVANKHSNQKIDGMTIADFVKENMAKYISVRALINRRNAIKRAITRSNASTFVNIGGETYTVAEAIDMKSCGVAYYQALLTAISSQNAAAVKTANNENGNKLEDRADTYIRSMYAGSDLKNMSDEIKSVRDSFISSQTYDVIDIIGTTTKMEELRNKIDSFMSEVDSALSVSNALTTIDVEYEA